MSIAQSPSAVTTLREWATQAYERQQAVAAERKRKEFEEARDGFIVEAREQLGRVFAQPSTEMASPYRLMDIRRATITIDTADDRVPERQSLWFAEILFEGERFEYRDAGDGRELIHIYTCPNCGAVVSPPTWSNVITSLSDLGSWLAYAPTIHTCQDGAL